MRSSGRWSDCGRRARSSISSPALPHLRDALTLRLHGEIALVRQRRTPKVQFNVEGLHRVGGFSTGPSWKALRRPLLATLRTIGASHGLRFIVGLAWHHRLSGIDTLDIRIEHAKTLWKTAQIGRFDHRVKEFIIINDTGERRMARTDLPAYLADRTRMPT